MIITGVITKTENKDFVLLDYKGMKVYNVSFAVGERLLGLELELTVGDDGIIKEVRKI